MDIWPFLDFGADFRSAKHRLNRSDPKPTFPGRSCSGMLLVSYRCAKVTDRNKATILDLVLRTQRPIVAISYFQLKEQTECLPDSLSSAPNLQIPDLLHFLFVFFPVIRLRVVLQ